MQTKEITPLAWWQLLLFALSGNTLVAVVLWPADTHGHFGQIWVVAQLIGLSIGYTYLLLEYLFAARCGYLILAGLAGGCGLLISAVAARLFGVEKFAEMFFGDWRDALHFLGLGVIFTAMVVRFFYCREHIHELEQAREGAELREKAALDARLRLLQAQIEPHFLFNTLANLHSLIGRDDLAARTLLERMNDYLRASLTHSRADRTSLDDECRLLGTYLGIQAQRMGGRLTWEIAVPKALRHLTFPPMLLQPLVENAIRHGLEPKLGSGRLCVSAREENDQLALNVSDDGVGLAGKSHFVGVGLANVRERLATLFGPAARLELVENAAAGLTAQLWIPKPGLAR
jgi:hypothetical protein